MVEKAGKLLVSESLHQVLTGLPIIHTFLSSTCMKTVEKNFWNGNEAFYFLFTTFGLVFLTVNEGE